MTTQIRYAAQAKTNRSPRVLAGGAAVILLAVAFLAGRASAPEPTIQVETTDPQTAPVPPEVSVSSKVSAESDAALREENRALRKRLNETLLTGADATGAAARVAELEAENENLRDQVADTREEVAEYRRALEAAVDELNRLGKSASTPKVPQQPAASRSRGQKEPPSVYLWRPDVTVLGNDLSVAGSAHNASSQDATGYVHLELCEDNDVVDTQRLYLEIPGRSVSNYVARFSYPQISGRTYSVQASWEIN